jgi:hypothetical protein
LNDDKYFINAGAKLNLSRKISAYLGYSFLTTSKLKQIQTFNFVVSGDTYDTITKFYSNNYKLYQKEAYANAQINAWKGFIVTPALHYLNVHFNTIFANTNAYDTLLPQIDTIPVKLTEYTVSENDTSFNNFVTSLSVSKHLSLFNLNLNGTWSNLNNKKQYQACGMVVFYPYGNLNLYTTTSFVSTWQDNINRFIFEQQVGVKILKKLWIEGFFTLGEMVNYNEKNGLVVYNSGDKINFRTGADFIIILSENIELSFRYRYTAEEGKLVRYSNHSYSETSLDYQNNTFIGGIKWKL